MDLYEKKIFAPEIIDRENIKAIVVAVPVYYAQIASLVQTNHRGVVEVIDICALTSRQYSSQERIGV